MYSLRHVPHADLEQARIAYLRKTTAPLDGMWENAFFPAAKHWAIDHQNTMVGYCATNEAGAMLAFDITENYPADAAFAYCLTELGIGRAFVSTAEPAYLSLCTDHQSAVAVNALMYEATDPQAKTYIWSEELSFRPLVHAELERAVAFGVDAIGANPTWLSGYFAERRHLGELFGLWRGDDLVVTGELRISPNQDHVADVGMIVATAHRKQGLATGVLKNLTQIGHSRGLRLICSTESSNIGAQKAIARAGFVSRHRILDIRFGGKA